MNSEVIHIWLFFVLRGRLSPLIPPLLDFHHTQTAVRATLAREIETTRARDFALQPNTELFFFWPGHLHANKTSIRMMHFRGSSMHKCRPPLSLSPSECHKSQDSSYRYVARVVAVSRVEVYLISGDFEVSAPSVIKRNSRICQYSDLN